MPAVTDSSSLGELDLFRGLAPDDLARLNALLRRRSVSAQVPIILEGRPGDMACVVLDGAVKVQVEQEGGSSVILAILGPGEVVGELGMLDGLGATATVVTLEHSTLLWIDNATLRDCLRTMPTMSHNLARILCRRLRLANDRVEALATLDVPGRVARQLLILARQYGRRDGADAVRVPFRLTQNELAELVGASRVRVNRALVAYKERRWISVDPRSQITVHDPAALARRCR